MQILVFLLYHEAFARVRSTLFWNVWITFASIVHPNTWIQYVHTGLKFVRCDNMLLETDNLSVLAISRRYF